MLPARLTAMFHVPLFRRVAFHARRIGGQVDRHFFTTLLTSVLAFVAVASLAVVILERQVTLADFGNTFYWAITTVIGSGDPSFVTSPGGFIVGWLLAFFGVALVAAMTGAVVGFVIDFLLKEVFHKSGRYFFVSSLTYPRNLTLSPISSIGFTSSNIPSTI